MPSQETKKKLLEERKTDKLDAYFLNLFRFSEFKVKITVSDRRGYILSRISKNFSC